MMTRTIGSTLIWIGATVGAASAVALLPLSGLHGLAWIAGVGMIKLSLAGSVGLMAGGALVRRLALRSEERRRAPALPAGAHPAPAALEEPGPTWDAERQAAIARHALAQSRHASAQTRQ